MGEMRWIAYGMLELVGWLVYVNQSGDAGALRDEYRDLAWNVARFQSDGPRRDGTFEYYEALTRFNASGAFDTDPETPGLQPEQDEQTFNGSTWALARALHFSADTGSMESPAELEAALAYYRDRAVRPDFAWSWGTNALEQQIFIGLIKRSDQAARTARMTLGLILANHLASAVDALITARLQSDSSERATEPIRVNTGFDASRGPLRWNASVRIAIPSF